MNTCHVSRASWRQAPTQTSAARTKRPLCTKVGLVKCPHNIVLFRPSSNSCPVVCLFAACELENTDMVRLLLSYGATVNQRCSQGWTAFHEAVSRDNTDICEMLIRAGASINPPNTYSVTPLIVAAQRGRLRALCYLMEKGAAPFQWWKTHHLDL